MKAYLALLIAAMSALPIAVTGKADAQTVPNFTPPPPPPPMHGFPGFFYVEPEVVHDVVVVHEAPAASPAPAPTPSPPREPFVIGRTYASLPGGCMKLIDRGKSYYQCSGEWYREVPGGGRNGPYVAVARP